MAAEPILIVDDNPANLKVARLALQSEDFLVRTAGDAEEALRILPELRPRLILMDIQLPGMDGLELTRRLKSDPATRHIVIIAVTAYAMKGDRERILAAGCDGYLSKPIDPLQLPAIVTSHLRALTDRPPPPTPERRPRVLVVEDNPSSRRILLLALGSHGFEVKEAEDGQTALDLYQSDPPDLVVQDLCLPDLDGAELLNRFRKLDPARRVPIFCVSGFLSAQDQELARGRGFDEVLAKPVDPSHLVDLARLHVEDPVESPTNGQARPRVLVAEDDPMQRRLAGHYLRMAGFEVTLVENGRVALEEVERSRPDAVVSDVLMPEMNGFELCMALRERPDMQGVPVILASSHYGEDADQKLAARVGATRLVGKASDSGPAISAVRAALATRAPPAQGEAAESAREEILRRTLAQLEAQVRRNERLSRQNLLQSAQLSVLASVAEALGKKGTLEQVLEEVLANCLDMAGISRGAFFWVSPSGLVPRFLIGFPANAVELWHASGAEALLQVILQTGNVTALPSPGLPEGLTQAFLAAAGLETMLVVPVAWDGRSFGAAVFGARSLDVTGREPMAFARVLGAQLGQALGLAEVFGRLNASEERFRVLVESLHDSVVVVDSELRCLAAYGGQSFGGLSEANVAGLLLSEVLGRDVDGLHEARTKEAFSGRSTTYDWALEQPEGSRFMQTVVSPMRGVNGEVAAVVRVTRDTTEHRRLQAQLMVADRLASMGTLAAGVAHEINNPLASVLANLELMAQQAEPSGLPSDFRAALIDAKEAADRVRLIVRDLKVFSRAEEEHNTAVDLQRVLDSAVRMTWNEVRHRARLCKEYLAVPLVSGNEARLGQVFVNLLVNAAQALPEGHADTNEIRVSAGHDESRVWVDVADSGPGIRPEHLRLIFNPFFTTKAAGIGTGLGLAICQRIVTELGGEITVESQAGIGTRFRVSLPISHQAIEVRPTPAPPDQVRRGRVLVVDDDSLIVTAVRRALGSLHDVQTFTSAEEALRLLVAGLQCDVILCDLMMPVMTGVDFYEALAQQRPEMAERVVFMTGGAFSVRARQALDQLPNERFEKPFGVLELRGLVARRVKARVGESSG
jgi:PAS domain S-box-containing protein